MSIYKTDCKHYAVCIENDESYCCDCIECESYEKEYTIEDGISDINDNYVELKSMFEHYNEVFEVLTRNLINLKEKDDLKVTLSMVLTHEIMEIYKIMLNTESIMNTYETTLTSSDKEQMNKTFEKCVENLNALCKIDANNGGSLILVLDRIYKQEDIPIGLIGISECETLITLDYSTGEFGLMKNPYPAKKDTPMVVEDVAI